MKRGAAVFFLVLMILLSGCNSSDYKKAGQLFNGGSYERALTMYQKLGDYKDSADQVPVCLERLGSETMAASKYKEAYIWYTQLLNYPEYRDTASEGLYEIGKNAIETKNWSLAVGCFSKIPTYENSQELLRRSKGMKSGSNFADSAFLEDAASAAISRVRASAANEKHRLVLMEQGYIEKYRTSEFYDSSLKEIAVRYSDVLRQELVASGIKDTAGQVAWLQSEVERYAVLNVLYRDYGLCADSTPFINCYIDGYDALKTSRDGFAAIDADVQSQVSSGKISARLDSNSVTLTLTNNTEYTYDLKVRFSFSYKVKGADRTLETVDALVRDITPGRTYKVKGARTSKSASATDFSFVWEYENIRAQ
ncbi:MAG: hypothetical protein IJK14_00515 [Clostridia bacterium]|nr:hypothetical protein [Clostridia bacterium]MBR0443844.1 hypothetical protein [Clostridia bacterium]